MLGGAVVLAVVALIVVRAVDRSPSPKSLPPVEGMPSISHVHGLGVNPANRLLYVATHHGVFKITGPGRAERIANRYQDTMGFTVAGPNHFYASGHPDMREDLPPLLGLLESTDGARTWQKRSLLGKADFHALRFAHARIYGYNSTGSEFMVSEDGRRWQQLANLTLRDFAVSPTDPKIVFATTPTGLSRSDDGGRMWSKAEMPAQPVVLDWLLPDRLLVLAFDGSVWSSPDAGTTWEKRAVLPAPGPAALVDAGDRIYAAVRGGIHSSSDGGRTWELFYETE
jgi:hypothetical protein